MYVCKKMVDVPCKFHATDIKFHARNLHGTINL